MRHKNLLFALAFLLPLAISAHADYVEVRKATNVRVEPDGSSDTAFRAEVGTNLQLVESETKNGYYHVEQPQTGTEGWIYRTLVRRFPGKIPEESETTSEKSTLGMPFPLKRCKLPYNEKPVMGLPIESCGLQGKAKDGSGEAVQNPVKNNLCLTGTAQEVTIANLAKLQQEVDDSGIQYGNKLRGKSGPPMDRAPLTTLPPVGNSLQIGDGSLVTFVGYLSEAHYSPKSRSQKGETVNCGKSEHEEADIHVSLSSKPGKIKDKDPDRRERLCKSISAEFVPHARPDIWDVSTLNKVIDLEHPVRVTGQLFFDASHEPCRNGEPLGSEPRRITSWEIHPIYTFEVCKFDDIRRCRATSNGAWQPISNADGIVRDDESDDD